MLKFELCCATDNLADFRNRKTASRDQIIGIVFIRY